MLASTRPWDVSANGFAPPPKSSTAAVFVNAHAEACRRARFAQAQIERVQMSAAPVDDAAVVDVRAEHAAHVAGFDDFELGARLVMGHCLIVLAQAAHVARAGGDFHPAGPVVAFDGVLGDALLDDLVAAIADVAHELGAGRAELALDAVLPADAADHLAAVAARRAPADAIGFEHDDRVAALGQVRAVAMPEKPPPMTHTSAFAGPSRRG